MRAVAEAPAKVIVTGEHFVVHGAWALAAAIPRMTRAVVEASPRLEVSSASFPDPRGGQLLPVRKVVEWMAERFSFAPGLRVTISSDVRGGAGLGSSAAASVAVASAVARYRSLDLRVGEIVEAAMQGERLVHGRPSGVDPEACARGGVILFRPGSTTRQLSMNGPGRLLVSFTGSTRSTKAQVSRVSEMGERLPALLEGVTKAVNGVSLLAAERLREGDYRGLGDLLNLSHAVLSGIGVSSPALDKLVDASLSLGSYGAKLTGGGGGGSVVSVAPKGKEKSITSGLNARGFETFRAKVPTEGVRSWLEP